MRPLVELVYDEDCPNVERTRDVLRLSLLDVGVPARWIEWSAADPRAPDYTRGLGSPTVLVDGCEVAPAGSRVAAACRLYPDAQGKLVGVPPPEAVTAAVRKSAAGIGRARGTNVTSPWFGRDVPADPRERTDVRQAGALSAASIAGLSGLTSVVASACCAGPILAPLVVGLMGAGGAAWAAGLKPYAFYILGAAGLLLASGFWVVYRRPKACAPATGAARAKAMDHVVKGVLWTAAVLWLISLGLNVLIARGG